MRKTHLLRRSKSDAYPANVVCVACRCDWELTDHTPHAEKARLVGWVATCFSGVGGEYGPDYECEGETADEFWTRLGRFAAKRGAATVFCERADLVCALLDLWNSVERGALSLGGRDERDAHRDGRNQRRAANVRVVLESPPFVVEGKVCGSGGKFKVLDLGNYGLQPSPDGTPVRDIVRRVSMFVRGMCASLRSLGLGTLKDTAGTQAMYSFRRKHLTHCMVAHNDERALNLEGDSYYGGRCEAFHVGRVSGPVYHLDVSSMYPFCARESDVPVSLAGVCNELGPGDQPQLGAGHGLIADVTIDTDEPAYPLRLADDRITVWPVGTFRTVLAGPELLDALSRDRVVRWHRASWYRLAPALRSYADCVLGMRQRFSDNQDLKDWAKSLGVCLIGKLGQRDRRWVDATSNVFHGPWATWWESREEDKWTRYRSLAGYTQREEVGSWSYGAIPAVAAWVCSLARVRLLRMIRCASWAETLYCDTDALMVTTRGLSNLKAGGWVREDEPGFLRVKNVSDEVIIHGIKAYDEEGRSVRLGRPLSVAGAGAGEVRYWAHRSAAGACKERRQPDARRIAVRHDRTEDYKHGLVCADGTVTPFQLNEG